MVRQPFNIWQEIINERLQDGHKEVSREIMRNAYFRAGYGPEKAEKWMRLYAKIQGFDYDKPYWRLR